MAIHKPADSNLTVILEEPLDLSALRRPGSDGSWGTLGVGTAVCCREKGGVFLSPSTAPARTCLLRFGCPSLCQDPFDKLFVTFALRHSLPQFSTLYWHKIHFVNIGKELFADHATQSKVKVYIEPNLHVRKYACYLSLSPISGHSFSLSVQLFHSETLSVSMVVL